MTGSVHDAEELLQDLFVKIAGQREKLLTARQLKPYLFRMAANLAYDRMRQDRRQERNLADYAFVAADNKPDHNTEKIGKLNQALETLPPEQKEAVVMKIYLQKTFEEIGGTLAISANTAVSRYRYALKKLKTMLEN